MVDQEQEKLRADLISRLFAQLTSRFEDAATIAADCQGARPNDVLIEGAERLREIARETMTIVDATLAILIGSADKVR